MRHDKLQDVAEMLEVLAREVRRMMREDDDATLTTVGITVSDASMEELYESGKRVRVIVRDSYFGRVGTLMGQRGKQFWNVKLEGRDGEVDKMIYKKQSSLALIE
jgi:hypothetical protein